MKHHFTAGLVVLLCWGVSGTRHAAAQEASSFEQLQVLVKPGDTVVVTDTQGRSTKGKIEMVSTESLLLKSGGNIREFAQRDTVQIKKRQADSLANGAIIGAAVGGTVGALGAVAVCNQGCSDAGGEIAAVIGIYAGLGAAVGVGLDALFKPRRTIYQSPGKTAFGDLHVAPLIGGGRRGVALKWSF